MEKLLGQYDKESMRVTMLKHEETFKQQEKATRLGKPSRAGDHHSNGMQEVIDESHIELTLGPPTKKRHGISAPPRTPDSGPSFSLSSTESCHTTMGYRNGSDQSNVDLGENLREERLRRLLGCSVFLL
ncbi:hypothetical protein GQ457_14G003460 [Hibiscus cannabinus]